MTIWPEPENRQVETAAGSGKFIERTVEQTVPIAIFESDEKTEVADIPVNAN